MSSWTDKRPMSPHMQIWRWHITMFGSIMHRATGCALYVGAMLIVAWLFSIAMGREAYDFVASITGSIYGLIVLFGFTLAVSYHLLNGVRHLFWDSGKGFTPKVASFTGWLVIVLAVLLTLAIWGLAYFTVEGMSVTTGAAQ